MITLSQSRTISLRSKIDHVEGGQILRRRIRKEDKDINLDHNKIIHQNHNINQAGPSGIIAVKST